MPFSASLYLLGVYPNTSEGLQSLIDDLLQAAKAKKTMREEELVHTLLVPEDSTWFVGVYGPGFGTRGWASPKILRYTDPESVNVPLDHFLKQYESDRAVVHDGVAGKWAKLSHVLKAR